jgi:hypothetical protein
LQAVQACARTESQEFEQALVLKLLARPEQQVSVWEAGKKPVLKLKARREFGAVGVQVGPVRLQQKARMGT